MQPDPFLRLMADGYCVLDDIASAEVVSGLARDLAPLFDATPFCRGGFYGERTKRFGGLLKRSRSAEALVMSPAVLAITDAVLAPNCDRWQLNLTQALQLHPGEGEQAPHRDEDMWGGPKGEVEYLVNVMWPLSPYTAENGATVIYARSHNGGGREAGERVQVEVRPGSALVFLGSTLHGGGANRSCGARIGVIVSYALGWLKPFENQWLVYPPAVARHFSPELAALVGYRQHRPNLGNYEGRCPSVLLTDPEADLLGAADELRPDQALKLEAWLRSRP